MSNSARENILEQVASVLSGISGATVYRSREAPVTRAEGAVIIIKPEEEKVTKYGNSNVIRELFVALTLIVRATSESVPVDQTADATLQLMHAAILSSDTLGGNAARIIEQDTKWSFEMADQVAVAIEVRYAIKYLTAANSLAPLS